jgi:hypothetical protein
MEKRNTKLKKNITQMIGQLSNIYKEVSQKENSAYLTGKKEAYEEMLNWLISSHNPDFRYISANSFLNIIQEKINKTKIQINNIGDEQDEELLNLRDLKQINFLDLKINDNKKRFNRFAQGQNSRNLTNCVNSNNNNSPTERDERNNNNNEIQFSFFNPFLMPSNLNNNNNNNSNQIFSQGNIGNIINNNDSISNNNLSNQQIISSNLNFINGNGNENGNGNLNEINLMGNAYINQANSNINNNNFNCGNDNCGNSFLLNGNVPTNFINNSNNIFLNNNRNANRNIFLNRSNSNSNSSSLSKRKKK